MKRNAPQSKKMRRGAFLILCAFVLMLSACLPEPPAGSDPTATITPSPSSSPTATIVWFPATPTFTPFPTRAVLPTQDMRPAVGASLLEDDFLNNELWPAQRSGVGSVGYGKSELTLAIATAKGQLVSLLPQKQFSDFYFQVDALPSLCRGADEYGLLFRAEGERETYRLRINCMGKMRLECEKNYTITPLQDWILSGQMPPGALLKTRLAIWAAGTDLRIFVNDVYQFSVSDPVFQSGQIGVFARASSDMPLTVSFSNLRVNQVDTGQVPTVVPTPTITLVPTATRLPTATNQP